MLKDTILSFSHYFRRLADDIVGRLFKDSFWSFWGSLVNQFLGLIVGVIASRILGRIQYGEYGIILNTVNLLAVLVGLGFNVTAIRYTSQNRVINSYEVGKIILSLLLINLGMAILGAGIYILSAPWLAHRILNAPGLTLYIQWSGLLLIARVLLGVISGFMIGMEWFRWTAFTNIVILIVGMPITVLLISEYKIIGAINSQLFLCLFSIFLYGYRIFLYFKRENIPWAFLRWPEIYKLVIFSLPAYVSLILVYPFSWLTNTFLVQQKDGYAQMGVVNAIMQIKNIVLFIPGVISQAVIPTLSDLYVNHSRDQILKVITFSCGLIILALLPIGAVMLLFPNITLGIFGHEFQGYSKELSLFIGSYIIMGVIAPISQVILVTGKMWIGVFVNLIWGILLVSISWYLIWSGNGAEGLAIANLISNLVLAFLHIPILLRLLPT